jgi:hypothetical protein
MNNMTRHRIVDLLLWNITIGSGMILGAKTDVWIYQVFWFTFAAVFFIELHRRYWESKI